MNTDIANEFGITRQMIKTDAEIDEEIYDVKRDAEVISDKIDIIQNDEVSEQVKYLEDAPGKMSYSEWTKAEFAREQEAVKKILSTKQGREAIVRTSNLDPEDIGDDTMVTLPNSVFTDFYSESNELEQQSIGRGNLYSAFMKVMSVR